ncbi:MAG: T9SS type A sorting domain-containing protein [Bacteroidetes bacterium]|nr:T9SS type A sorting domain-containing protein [Bacteroidota bacterium]
MKKLYSIYFLLLIAALGHATTKRVLFLGNSYTYYNDMPQLLANLAAANGDTLIFDSHTVGGYTIGNHSVDTASLNKIMLGGWDRVVIQGQSAELVTDTPELSPFPYARKLDSLVHRFNPCGETMFYMTWGYKYGDTTDCVNYPLFCGYEVMDSTIRGNYLKMANVFRAEVAPAGPVRHYIRHHYPAIELYQADESHPTPAGSYAVACAFYATIFRKDPSGINYNGGLPVADADSIQVAARTVAFDSLSTWLVGTQDAYVDSLCSTLSVAAVQQNTTITLYPNPAGNTITILAGNLHKQQARIYSATGLLCREFAVGSNTTIDISALSQGLYFIRFNSGVVTRFVKE